MTLRVLRIFCSICASGKAGLPSEVAEAILFLVAKESSYVNGAVFNVTGGIDWVY